VGCAAITVAVGVGRTASLCADISTAGVGVKVGLGVRVGRGANVYGWGAHPASITTALNNRNMTAAVRLLWSAGCILVMGDFSRTLI
jgi:hypothetical protein